jgi:hypothetical protein
MSLRLLVTVQSAIVTSLSRRDDRGQATAEYALVILGAAAMALLVIAWATNTSKVSTLLNKVVDSVASRVA